MLGIEENYRKPVRMKSWMFWLRNELGISWTQYALVGIIVKFTQASSPTLLFVHTGIWAACSLLIVAHLLSEMGSNLISESNVSPTHVRHTWATLEDTWENWNLACDSLLAKSHGNCVHNHKQQVLHCASFPKNCTVILEVTGT